MEAVTIAWAGGGGDLSPSLVKMQKRRQMEDGKETELRDLVADRSGV